MSISRAESSSAKARHERRHHKRKRVWSDKHWRWVPTRDGGWRVQAYIVHHRHKPPRHHFRGPGPKPPSRVVKGGHPRPPASQPPPPPAPPPGRDPRPPGAYQGPFGVPQAVRLLNRAGFGPRPGQAEQLASLGLVGAVQSLTRPSGEAKLSGPDPVDQQGNPIRPADVRGDDHLWWLDRMVRSDQQLVERMALVFHDWFATSLAMVSTQQQMIDQSNLFRSHCFGSFLDLFKAVTIDPAMLQWLNGNANDAWAPNENYAREMMELFSLGAGRGAYTEDDVREQARALTGWTNDHSDELGEYNFHFDPDHHDSDVKTVFGQSGNWDWQDACRLCVEHPLHPSFFVGKLWSCFVAEAPPDATRDALTETYRSSGWQIRPVLEAILMSPQLYEGAPMVKPPVVQLAGMLRAIGRSIDTNDWVWLCEAAGQRLFWPPNVAGWDDAHWLDTARMRGRWIMADFVLVGISVDPHDGSYSTTETPDEALARAVASWGSPSLRAEEGAELLDLGRRVEALIVDDDQASTFRALRQNALLQLIGVSPDLILQ